MILQDYFRPGAWANADLAIGGWRRLRACATPQKKLLSRRLGLKHCNPAVQGAAPAGTKRNDE